MTVKISSKYQVVIPESIRRAMRVRPGTKAQIFQYENRIELVPEQSPRALRGFVKGIDTTVPREKDRA